MKKVALFTVLMGLIFSCKESNTTQETSSIYPVTKIAFGSCGHETDSLLIFNNVVRHQPDYFIFLGDNIYGDTKDMEELKAKYAMLAAKPSFQNLQQHTEILATWDDHDYGWNDMGRHYPFKAASKELFLDFFKEPIDSERRKHEGIYTSSYKKIGDKVLQIILLDGRTFRDDIKTYEGEFDEDRRYFYSLDYAPHQTADSTLLGEQQWAWLKKELIKPADLRLIGTGTQFGIEYNGYEAWANFPSEQQRMIDLIAETKANGVLFISGDVHYAELSKITPKNTYPLYDFTSSGLSSTWHFATPNKNRIEGPIMDNHFGLISVDWNQSVPSIQMEIWDIHDNQRIEYTLALNELHFN